MVVARSREAVAWYTLELRELLAQSPRYQRLASEICPAMACIHVLLPCSLAKRKLQALLKYVLLTLHTCTRHGSSLGQHIVPSPKGHVILTHSLSWFPFPRFEQSLPGIALAAVPSAVCVCRGMW